MIIDLVIGSVTMPKHTLLNFSQSYQDLNARSVRRLADGTANIRETWSGKIKTDISASGWIPPGLAGLDFSQELTIKCAEPRASSSNTNSVTIPAARRSDISLKAWAIVDGEPVETTISDVTNNVVTIDTVAGENGGYRVDYYPEFTATINPPTESLNASAAEYSWSITAEQV